MVDIENEIWKETHLSPYYLVSNMGRVKSIAREVPCANGVRKKKEKILTPNDSHGYLHVGFLVNGKYVAPLIHQLVMFAFKEIRKYPEWEIDHINGDSHDNRLENLEYVTSSENTKRAYALGLQSKEVLSLSKKSRKMTPEEIIEMKETFLKEGRIWGLGYNNKDFLLRYAEKYNMKPNSIQNILTGKTNRFFGKDIVQTTKIEHPIIDFNSLNFSQCKTTKDKLKVIANAFNLGIAGVETQYYQKFKDLEALVSYYNKRFNV